MSTSGRTRLPTPNYGFIPRAGATNTIKDISDSRCIGTVGSGQGCVLQSYTIAIQVCDSAPTCGGFICWDEAGLDEAQVLYNKTDPLDYSKQCFVFVKPIQLVANAVRQNAYIKAGEPVILPNGTLITPFPIAGSSTTASSIRPIATSIATSITSSSPMITTSQPINITITSAKQGLDIGSIIGIVVGGVGLIAMAIIVAFIIMGKRKLKKMNDAKAQNIHQSPAYGQLNTFDEPQGPIKFEAPPAGSHYVAMGGSSQAGPAVSYQNQGMQETKGSGLFSPSLPTFTEPSSVVTTMHPQMWSPMDTISWLYSRGLAAEIITVFEQNNLNGSDLLSLDAYRLSLLGLHDGPPCTETSTRNSRSSRSFGRVNARQGPLFLHMMRSLLEVLVVNQYT
ncbi:hypothetical protein BC829DRAFT_436661 [Chytridium lagenaria]|nr:hypothetical protein BC829DRAFT_436661 [Chytridium lagenaria]